VASPATRCRGNRRKILVAADRLFAEEGLGVGHDQIARTAGVAVGTVYRRFPDKSSLIAALYTEQVDRAVDAARSARMVEDPWAAVVQFLTTILQMQADSRGLRELSAASPHGHEPGRYLGGRGYTLRDPTSCGVQSNTLSDRDTGRAGAWPRASWWPRHGGRTGRWSGSGHGRRAAGRCSGRRQHPEDRR